MNTLYILLPIAWGLTCALFYCFGRADYYHAHVKDLRKYAELLDRATQAAVDARRELRELKETLDQ